MNWKAFVVSVNFAMLQMAGKILFQTIASERWNSTPSTTEAGQGVDGKSLIELD